MTEIVGIDHVAIVTHDLDKARKFYRKLGLTLTRLFHVTEKFPEESKPHKYVAIAVLFKNRGPVLWIMQPVGSSGPLNRFLAQKGPGLHHISLRVGETRREETRLRRKGVSFIRHAMVDGREVRALIDPNRVGFSSSWFKEIPRDDTPMFQEHIILLL